MSSVENFFARLFGGSANEREVKRLKPMVARINTVAESYGSLTDEELKAKTLEFRYRLRMGETLDDILPEAFAAVKETCRRLVGKKWLVRGHEIEWNMVPYDVQIIGAIVLHEGKIAEMATGEGKTLVATMPLYLNALAGRGAHLVTVNDYLAQRDCEWMGKIYEFLGLSAMALHNELEPAERRRVYSADITYGTNNEFGFDYLRDNMAVDIWSVVQRPLNYAIVDEVDSVLIDEARTPLIISGAVGAPPNIYNELKPVVANLYRRQQDLVDELFRKGKDLLDKDEEQAGLTLLRVHRGDPKNAKLLELLTSEFWVKKLIEKLQGEYEINKEMGKIDGELYYTIDEKSHVVDITEKGRIFLSGGRDQDMVFKIQMLDQIDERLGQMSEQKKAFRFFIQDVTTGHCRGLSDDGVVALCSGSGDVTEQERGAIKKLAATVKELPAFIAATMQSSKSDKLGAYRRLFEFAKSAERKITGLNASGLDYFGKSVGDERAVKAWQDLLQALFGDDAGANAAAESERNRELVQLFFDVDKQLGVPTAIKPEGELAVLVMLHQGDPSLLLFVLKMAGLLNGTTRSGGSESAQDADQKNLDYFELSDKGGLPKHISEKGRIAILGGNPDLYILPDRTIVEERDRQIQELLDRTLNQASFSYSGRVQAIEAIATTLEQMQSLENGAALYTRQEMRRSDSIEPVQRYTLTGYGQDLVADFSDQTRQVIEQLDARLRRPESLRQDAQGRWLGLTAETLDQLLGVPVADVKKKIEEWRASYKPAGHENDVQIRFALDGFLEQAFAGAGKTASWSRKYEEVERIDRTLSMVLALPWKEEWSETERLRHYRRYFILEEGTNPWRMSGLSDGGMRTLLGQAEHRGAIARRLFGLMANPDVEFDAIMTIAANGYPGRLQKSIHSALLEGLPFVSHHAELERLREEVLRMTAKKVNSKQEADAILPKEKSHFRARHFMFDDRELNELIYKAHAPHTVISMEEIEIWCTLHLDRVPRRQLDSQRDHIWRNYTQVEERVQNISQLLRAFTLYHKDVDYVVKGLEESEVRRMGGQKGRKAVMIVDQFTGRLMPGRRFSDGLHEALEAKEGVEVQAETQTLATITIQNFFRLYKKIAGMTGTAETERQEFFSTYKLEVVVIPTNRNVIRTDHNDVIFRTKREKYNAIIEEALEMHEQGRPVLVGTVSVDVSQRLSEMLAQRGVPIANWLKKGDVTQELESGRFHTVLNAKYHKQEAEIITKAGLPGMINIATNMAGRGTDIKLSPEVVQKGGLHIIGSEKHEARRIDRQLRGRSGRQGDPGSSRFYLSLEDDLMRLFGSDRITTMMSRLGPMEEGERIEHPLITKSIERAQKKVEERNFEIRKNLLEYDTVLNEQRKIIYKRRQNLLGYASAEDFVESKAKRYCNEEEERTTWNLQELIERLQAFFKQTPDFTVTDLEKYKADEIKAMVLEWVEERLEEEEFFHAMQLRHRLLGFTQMDALINELVRLKIRLHNGGTRDTSRWNVDGIAYELERIFKRRPELPQNGAVPGDAEAVEQRLAAWARQTYAEKMQACAAIYDSALYGRLTLDEMLRACLAGLMVLHLSPLAPVVSWTTEAFLNDLQRLFGEQPELGVNEIRTIRREKIFDVVLAWMNDRRTAIPEEQLRHRIIGQFSTIQFSQAVVYAMVSPAADEDTLMLTAEQKKILADLFGEDFGSLGAEKEKRAWQVLAERVLQARTEAMREEMEEYRTALLADATIEECIEATVANVARQIVFSSAPLEERRRQLGNAMEYMLLQRPPKAIPEKQDEALLAMFVENLVAWALALYKTYADHEERIQQEALSREILRDSIAMMIDDTVYGAISTALEGQEDLAPHQIRRLEADCRLVFRQAPRLADDTDRLMSPSEVMNRVAQWAQSLYQKRIDEIGADAASRYERFYVLEKIDENWRQHLNGVDELREGIGLRGYGQKDPLLEYKGEAYQMFVKMIDRINREVVSTLFRVFDVGGELEEQHLRRSEPRNYMTTHSQVDVFKQSAAAPAAAAAPAPAQPARTAPIVKSISIGRNDPCPCGSGKKYKQCCGKNL